MDWHWSLFQRPFKHPNSGGLPFNQRVRHFSMFVKYFEHPNFALLPFKRMVGPLIVFQIHPKRLRLVAVQYSGWLLQFVPVKTPEICRAAVHQAGCALQYVPAALQTRQFTLFRCSTTNRLGISVRSSGPTNARTQQSRHINIHSPLI